MNRRSCASSCELNFEGRDDAAAGLQRSSQNWVAGRRNRERFEALAAGLLEFYGDDVAIRGKPRCGCLKRGGRTFTKFLEARKRLGDGNGRFPAH